MAPAASIAALIARDCELEWVGANVGFLGGLFGFVGLLGIRAWLAFGPAKKPNFKAPVAPHRSR